MKKHGENIDKPLTQIYVNKIKNRITFKIKDGYSLELLRPETMKLLESTEKNNQRQKQLNCTTSWNCSSSISSL